MNKNVILSLQTVTKQFGSTIAVKDLTFEVTKGDILGILGPNGAGKSTTLSMICGLVKPNKGKILIESKDVFKQPKEAKKIIGALLERPIFYNYLSAIDNLRIFGAFRNCKNKDYDEVLDKVNLSNCKDKKVKCFSQGMKARLGLATALLGYPSLLILDEPTSNLDPESKKSVLKLIKNISKEHNITVVMSSNLLSDIEAICDRIIMLKNGTCVLNEWIEELLRPKENIYLIKVKPLDQGLAALKNLRNLCAAFSLEGEYMKTFLNNNVTIAELNRELVKRGCDIYEVVSIKDTLDDLFFQINK